jgi:hypothetical protein
MLARAGASDVAARVDAGALEDALPHITRVAFRARFEHDDEAALAGALAAGRRA